MDIKRIPPDGDPFYAKAPPKAEPKAPREHPHACWHGLVFLAYTVFDEELGEEIEETEAIPCRRCAEEAR